MAKIITFTSGKGGVGKTNLCANLAMQLSAQGYRICIFDADFGLANINIVFGLRPPKTIADVILHGIPLQDIMIKNYHGIDIIPGCSGIEAIANLEPAKCESLIESFSLLDIYDFVFIDTGAGIAKNVISLCLASSEVIIVITPEPTSLVDAYALLKVLCMNGADSPVKVVVNHCKNTTVAKRTYARFQEVVQKNLYLEIQPLGLIIEDPKVSEAVLRQRPFVSHYPNTIASKCIRSIANKYLQTNTTHPQKHSSMNTFWKQCIATFKGRLKIEGLTKNKKLVKRKFRRFPTSLYAQYGFNGTQKGNCQLTDLSEEGLAIKLNIKEQFEIVPRINLSINFTSMVTPIHFLLNLKWVNKLDNPSDFNMIAGGIFTEIDSYIKRSLLENAFNSWVRND
jgi:flagellar biosynthesis protein FlhG